MQAMLVFKGLKCEPGLFYELDVHIGPGTWPNFIYIYKPPFVYKA